MMEQTIPAFATISDWSAMTGMARTAIYRAMAEKNLRAVKRGKRTLIDTHAGMAWLASLPEADIRGTYKKEPRRPVSEAKDQIRRMAARAMRENHGDLEGARTAFLSYLSRDELLVLFEPWIKPATGDYLRAAASKREDDQSRGADKARSEISSSPPPSKATQVREHARSGPSAGVISAAIEARRAEARNLLRSFTVNGKPIGDVTALEARGWAKSHKRDARFVELLASGVPDMSKIGDHRTAQEAEKVYAQVQKETADA